MTGQYVTPMQPSMVAQPQMIQPGMIDPMTGQPMMQQPGMIDPMTGQYMTPMQPGRVDKEALKELEQFQKFRKNIK